MKIRTLLIAIVLFSAQSCIGQTWDEWFRQNKTQTKYLIEQIAALKAYAKYAQKGYSIAKEGLGNISRSTLQEFTLHTDHYNSMKTVNPVVKRHYLVGQIYDLHDKILIECANNLRAVRSTNQLAAGEKDYAFRVLSRVRQDSDKAMDDLEAIITNRKLEMSDDERLAHIQDIYEGMELKFQFCKQFVAELKSLVRSRTQNENEIKSSEKLFGIK